MHNTRFNKALIRLGLIFGLLAVVFAGVPSTASAQGNSRTFPETGRTVSGRFLEYWNANGGLAQQGYPLSEAENRVGADGRTYLTQYFERAVFELHPENAAPNDVLLSRLGAEKYRAKYPNGAPGQAPSTDNPRFFGETGKTIGGRFRQYWEANGGLAQQGFPLSDQFQEVAADGRTYTVQYFERAVFEYHPENAAPNDVLLSRLGAEKWNSVKGTAPSQPSQPTGGGRPADRDAYVDPVCGVASTQFILTAFNFTPNEPLSFWLTAPTGDVIGTARPLEASHEGAFTFQVPTTPEFAAFSGWWAITFQGAFSGHQSVGYFYVARTQGECANIGAGGPPTPPNNPPTTGGGRPADRDAFVEPVCGVASTQFILGAYNFTPNEPLSFWLTAPTGDVIGTARPLEASHEGSFTFQIPTTPEFAAFSGWWAITFQGAYSGHQSVGYFYVARTQAECAGIG